MGVKKLFSGSSSKRKSSSSALVGSSKMSNATKDRPNAPLSSSFPAHLVDDDTFDAGSQLSSIHLGGSITSLAASRHSRVGGSPRSVDELDLILPTTSGRWKVDDKPPIEMIPMRGGFDSQDEMFVALDQILSEIKDDDCRGIEVDIDKNMSDGDGFVKSANNTSFDQSTAGGAVEVSTSASPVPNVAFSDMRMFALCLVGHGHQSVAGNIVRNSLERHLDFFFEARKADHGLIDGHNPTFGESDKADRVAGEMMSKRQYGRAIVVYTKLVESQQRMSSSEASRTLGRLAILHLLVDNERASLAYAKRSLKMSRDESKQMQSAISLLLLGLVYFGFGQMEKALRTWREALQMVILVFGYDHPYVAIVLNNLGCLHYLLKDFGSSLTLFSESMDLNRKFLGASVGGSDSIILDIAFGKSNVAMILARCGNLDAAIALLEEALSLQESMVSKGTQPVTVDTKLAIDRIGGVIETAAAASTGASSKFFSCHADLSDAVAVQTVDTFQRIHIDDKKASVFGNSDGIPMRRSGGKSPIDAVDATDNLDAIILGSLVKEYTPRQRVRAAVLCWFDKTLQDDERDPMLPFVAFQSTPRKRTQVPIDLDKGSILDAELYLQGINDQAADHLEHDEIEEGLELFTCALHSHRDKYGGIHHLVGTANHNIGMVHLYAQKYVQALTFFQEAVTVRGAALGTEHPEVAASLMKIGMIFLLQRDPEGAKETFFRVLKILKKSLGSGHIQVARVLNNIGVTQYDVGSYTDAFQSFQEAHDIQRRLLKMANAEGNVLKTQTRTIELALTNSLSNIGFLYSRQKNYKDSLRALHEADQLRRNHGGLFAPDNCCLEENLRYVTSLVRDIERKQSVELESTPSRLEWMLDNMRCIEFT